MVTHKPIVHWTDDHQCTAMLSALDISILTPGQITKGLLEQLN